MYARLFVFIINYQVFEMKRAFVVFFIMLGMAAASNAQTFTSENSDGVEIKYTVTTGNYVKVVSNNYSGRVAVPQSVSYEGTEYVVNEVGMGAFRNCSNLTFVSLPATTSVIGNIAFNSSNNLDTLVLQCAAPPTSQTGDDFNNAVFSSLFGDNLKNTITVNVPSGSLAAYRRSAWGALLHLTSVSAVPITIYSNIQMEIWVGNVQLCLPGRPPAYYDVFFEVGDTACIAAYRTYSNASADSLFMGWSNGAMSRFVVEGADTIRPIFDAMGYASLAANNVATPVKFNGMMGFLDGTSHYYVPAGSYKSPLFATGLWMGGIESTSGLVFTCASRFSNGDYVPGPLTADYRCQSDLETRRAFNRLWSVSRDEIDDFIAHIGQDGYSIPENILSWPGNGGEGFAEHLAPFYDADSDGIYNPHHGDYPLIRGDRMLYAIFNDMSNHDASFGDAMGMEIHLSAYAFDEPEDAALNNTVFLSFRAINRSSRPYRDVYFGAFSDFDLGYAADDFIGSNVQYGMAYGYNGDETDGPGSGSYDGVTPAQSCTILAGGRMDADGIDNPKVDIEKMGIYYPGILAGYANPNGGYDTVRLTHDAIANNFGYPDAWHFTPGDTVGNNAINGFGFGNGIVDDERLGMTHFVYYENSMSSVNGEPTSVSDYYNYLHGYWKNGVHMKYGGNALNTGTSDLNCNFIFPNDSDPLHWGTDGVVPTTNPDDWNEVTVGNAPGDRRGLSVSGPFSMNPGEEQTLDLAFTTSLGSSVAMSVEQLKANTHSIRYQFYRDTTFSGKPFTYRPYSAPIVAIENAATQPSMKVYPNPAHSIVTVALGSGNATDVDLYDINGRKVKSVKKAQGIVNIDISGLLRGVYMLRCGSEVTKLVIY